MMVVVVLGIELEPLRGNPKNASESFENVRGLSHIPCGDFLRLVRMAAVGPREVVDESGR